MRPAAHPSATFRRRLLPGGEIGLVQEGDIISIDIPNSKVNVNVSDEELEARRAKYVPREPNVKSGWLYRYSRLVTSADQGAVVR